MREWLVWVNEVDEVTGEQHSPGTLVAVINEQPDGSLLISESDWRTDYPRNEEVVNQVKTRLLS
jgi:hypothetical protein